MEYDYLLLALVTLITWKHEVIEREKENLEIHEEERKWPIERHRGKRQMERDRERERMRGNDGEFYSKFQRYLQIFIHSLER